MTLHTTPVGALPVHTRITDYVHQYASEHSEWEAVVFGKERVTYRELEARVENCARGLLAMGIGKGDRVATLCTPRTEYWVMFLATTAIGAIWLGVNPKYTLDECRYVIGDAKPKLLFTLAEFEGRDYRPYAAALMQEFDFVERTVALADPMPDSLSYSEFIAEGDQLAPGAYQRAADAVAHMDPALLVYTSGSTGKPRGAVLSHYGLCYGSVVQHLHYGLCMGTIVADGKAEGDGGNPYIVKEEVSSTRTICSFPINHVACVVDTCCVKLVGGGALIFHERFDPGLTLETIEIERVEHYGGVPTMLLMMLEHPDFERTDLSSIRLIGWGGAAIPEAVVRRLQKITPCLTTVYGMTETATNTTFSRYGASFDELCHSIGQPSPWCPCRIVNVDGELCAPGEVGELQFKGEYLLLEYFNRPEATRDVYTEDRWLHTGDVGYWREDGNITLVSRLSEMYKSGGYNVYPQEIEILLESHPDIDMAAVVGVPDSLYQEVGAAYVLPRNGAEVTADQLREFCREHLANYKVPKTFVVSTELPILSVGKIDKVALKKRHAEQTA